jgi:tRNA (guanine-N7-)-methyltransferase
MGRRRRIRQHVNPLAAKYAAVRARAIEVPAHLGPSAPCDVELGCADAQFTLELARRHPERVVVGIDIRERIVEFARRDAEAAGLANVRLAYCNMNVDLDRVLPPASVDRFHLLFPDPWFKAKHHKRRVIEPDLLELLRTRLRAGGELHVASDVYEIALEAMAEIDGDPSSGFANIEGPWRFTRSNPYGACSRREDTTHRRGQRVWRLRWRVITTA